MFETEQEARERAEQLAHDRTIRIDNIHLGNFAKQIYYEGYMAAWRDAQ